MSAEVITFNGDALAQRVELLEEFVKELTGTAMSLEEILLCRWAGNDEQSQLVRAAVLHLLGDLVLGVFGQLANAAGFQGEKVGITRQIGVNTEATNTEAVPEIGGVRG